jgi:hypothetical protein
MMERSPAITRRWRSPLVFGLLAAGSLSCAGGQAECAGPGIYSRGKEGGPTCCPNLNEYGRLVRYEQGTGEATCADPVGHAEFGCIAGACGDGTCEVGEQGVCGCTRDCSTEEDAL